MKPILFTAALLAATAAPATANQAPPPAIPLLESGEGRAVAGELADMLEGKFVDPSTGARYAAGLRAKAAAGRYDSGNWKDLVDRVNDDVQAIHPDGHLRMFAGKPPRSNGEPPAGGGERQVAVEAGRWIARGIAYLRINEFPGSSGSLAAVRAFMTDHAAARSMIFDIRNHDGGGLAEMDAIFPFLYAEPTPLVVMQLAKKVEDENGTFFGPESQTLKLVPSPSGVNLRVHRALPDEKEVRLRKAKVYLLTSKKTGSAAEHFALAMKRTKRATLVGSATAGANHFGGVVELGKNFSVFLPVGRTYDPDTGKDWEGEGVAPDIAVDPNVALATVLEIEGIAPAEARQLSEKSAAGGSQAGSNR